ncbi:MAG: nitroreductase [Phycisphaera sp.]|nr:nitroreductase [Phycisphaera sp.]
MPDNKAPSDWPLHDLIAARWSPRAFEDRAVEHKKLMSLLEAMRWAPSCFNEQPWRLLVATKDDPTEYERMLGCLVEFNQGWAKAAPVLMIAVASLEFERNGKPNAHGWHDVGLGLENMALQATSMGLQIHMMAGFDTAKARAVYGIPDNAAPTTAIAIGYPGDANDLSADLRDKETAPRERRELESIVFSGRWGKTSSLLKGD